MGTPESALDPMGAYLADTFVVLKKQYAGRSTEELQEAIRAELMKDNPNQEVSFTQPIEMRFNEMLEGSRADVSLRIYGPDLDKLFEFSSQAINILSGIQGVDELSFDPLTALTKSPVLDVELDYEKLAKYGVPLKDVSGILEASMGGRPVGSFFSHNRRFPVVVHLDESLRNNVAEIARVPVGLSSGGTIPLSYVTDVKQYDQVTTVARSGAKRYSALAIYLKDRDIAGFVAEAQEKMSNNLKLPSGYELSWGGQFKNLRKAQQRLAIIVPIVLLAIFLFLLRNFGNFRHAALVFSAIPLAMSGGVFSLYLRDIHFSVSAAVGFIVLAGIATLNSVVLVGYFNQLRSQGVSVAETVFQGALARLRPVSMTALVASLGFLPMALNTGTGAEVQRPLATVVIGGLITSTILTLIVVPVLYAWLEQRFARNA
jgi:cobalt-zinc-cadmium resistance protein CzcA